MVRQQKIINKFLDECLGSVEWWRNGTRVLSRETREERISNEVIREKALAQPRRKITRAQPTPKPAEQTGGRFSNLEV